jgi:hypothetical protein
MFEGTQVLQPLQKSLSAKRKVLMKVPIVHDDAPEVIYVRSIYTGK